MQEESGYFGDYNSALMKTWILVCEAKKHYLHLRDGFENTRSIKNVSLKTAHWSVYVIRSKNTELNITQAINDYEIAREKYRDLMKSYYSSDDTKMQEINSLFDQIDNSLDDSDNNATAEDEMSKATEQLCALARKKFYIG